MVCKGAREEMGDIGRLLHSSRQETVVVWTRIMTAKMGRSGQIQGTFWRERQLIDFGRKEL